MMSFNESLRILTKLAFLAVKEEINCYYDSFCKPLMISNIFVKYSSKAMLSSRIPFPRVTYAF